jgi:hypothetical protein
MTDPGRSTSHNAAKCEQCGETEDAFCPYADYEAEERPPKCINEEEPSGPPHCVRWWQRRCRKIISFTYASEERCTLQRGHTGACRG